MKIKWNDLNILQNITDTMEKSNELYCGNCGAIIPEKSEFCSKCGFKSVVTIKEQNSGIKEGKKTISYKCKACEREIHQYNIENFKGLCADCWHLDKKGELNMETVKKYVPPPKKPETSKEKGTSSRSITSTIVLFLCSVFSWMFFFIMLYTLEGNFFDLFGGDWIPGSMLVIGVLGLVSVGLTIATLAKLIHTLKTARNRP